MLAMFAGSRMPDNEPRPRSMEQGGSLDFGREFPHLDPCEDRVPSSSLIMPRDMATDTQMRAAAIGCQSTPPH